MKEDNQKSILLVEDEAFIAIAERLQLERYGYHVHHVNSGEKAVQTILDNTHPVDLILMDINLGSGIDGTEAAEQILHSKDIPIVFLSSHTEPDVVEKTEKITSYGYVVKGSSITVLDASIKMAFKLFEAKMLEQQYKTNLLHSRDLMSYIIEHNRGAVAVHDRDMNYVYVSKQYLDQYNVQERDVIGKHHYDVFPDLPQEFRDAHQRALHGEVTRGDHDLYKRNDGSITWTRWECRPWYEADNSIGGFIVYTEVLSNEDVQRVKSRDTINYLRSILRTTPDGFCVLDMEGRILDVNDAYCKMCGYSQEEMLQLSIDNIDFDEQPERTAERLQQIKSNGKASFEARNRRKDGTVFDIEVSASFVGGEEDRVVAFYRDITDRNKVEYELKAKNYLLERIFQNNTDLLALTDIEGNYTMISEAHRVLGYSLEDLIGKNVMDFVHPQDIPDVQNRFVEFLQTPDQKSKVVYRNRCSNGEYLWLETIGTILKDEHGIPEQILFNSRDISEYMLAEQEIQRQLAEKETLLKEVHHRIKNNMAQVESLLFLQATSTESLEVKSALTEAMSRVHSTRTLYEKLLVGNGHQEVSMKDYLDSLIDSVVEVFNDHPNVTIEKSIVDFSLSSKKAIPVGIIFNELLTNVFKYAFGDRSEGNILIKLEKTESRVTLIVKDDGIGIDSRVTANKSPGFGLTLTEMLAEQLNGTFIIENNNGTRSVVEFEI